MVIIKRLALVYLLAAFFFAWGLAAAHYQIFPWSYISAIKQDIVAFVRGDVNEDLTLVQRFQNDLGISPERHLREYSPLHSERFREVALEGIRSRRDRPRIWISPSASDNYRLIAGAFDFEKAFWGAILLDPAGRVVHRWHINAEDADLTDEPDVLQNLYGLAFFPNGSAAFTMQERSGGIIKIDACSRIEWVKRGHFHHVVSPLEDYSAFWTFGGRQRDLHPILFLIDAESGETIKKIDMAEVEKANPEILIFDLQREEDTDHPTHPNDIDPLPTELANLHPAFSAGDLLISYHTTNLIFVVDPRSLKIKWWYVGAGDGQHDPDWQDDGTISVFNNNWRAKRRGAALTSTIVSIDPVANTHRVVVDGERFDFYSEFNGHHHITEYGTVIVTSSTQGRVFEVDLATGEVVFEYVNAYDWDDGRTLHLGETFVIDKERAERWASGDCSTEYAREGE